MTLPSLHSYARLFTEATEEAPVVPGWVYILISIAALGLLISLMVALWYRAKRPYGDEFAEYEEPFVERTEPETHAEPLDEPERSSLEDFGDDLPPARR